MRARGNAIPLHFKRLRSVALLSLLGPFLTFVLAIALLGCGANAAGQDDRWQLTGQLLAWDGQIWIVDGTPLRVPEDVAVTGEQSLGATVTAAGSFSETGERVADRVELAPGELPDATLPNAAARGSITAIDGTIWRLETIDVIVPAGTPIHAADPAVDPKSLVAPGNLAEVAGYLAGSRVIATEVWLAAPPPNASQPSAPWTPTPAPPPDASGQDPADDTSESDAIDGGSDDDGDGDEADSNSRNDDRDSSDHHRPRHDEDKDKDSDKDEDKDKDEKEKEKKKSHRQSADNWSSV